VNNEQTPRIRAGSASDRSWIGDNHHDIAKTRIAEETEMPLIDTHAHLTYPGLIERIDEVLANCRAADVTRVISVASDADDGARALALARAHAMIASTAGIHPHQAGKVQPGDIERVAEQLAQPEVVAAGEMGLDYHYDFADRDAQRQVFSQQLEIARACEKPLVIHCREAFADCVELLEAHGYRDRLVVVHCFTGTADEAEQLAQRGWRISFTGIVTFKNSRALQQIARDYPADKLMVETDAPYLTPAPIRQVRPNEPAYVAHTARFLADLRGEDAQALAEQTTTNARNFFGV
jgi:TatD DNase family protein